MKTEKVVFITGASSGIGLLIANKLHNNGFKVYGTSRFPEKYQDKVPFELLQLDITSQESINKCLETLLSKNNAGPDILINNAAALITGSVEETSIEKAHQQFETGFWGAVKITKAILPLMRQQRKGQIITIGSLVGLIGMPNSSYYSASKHALEGFFKSLRFEVKAFNIKISVVEPEFFKTNIGHAAQTAEASIPEYDHTRKIMSEFFRESIAKATTAEPVSETIFKIVHSRNPKFSYRVGNSAKFLPILQFMSPNLFEKGFLKTIKL